MSRARESERETSAGGVTTPRGGGGGGSTTTPSSQEVDFYAKAMQRYGVGGVRQGMVWGRGDIRLRG